ncbi:hypothetical protein U1Q18_045420 [Sarracenia purpurea var. burkii]
MAIWDPFLSKCADIASDLVLSHLGYVFHCSINIQKLKNEKENLENERTRINIMVESEKRNAKIILPDVENWQTSVEKMKEEIDEFLRDEQRKNMRCFKYRCPNIRWRYRLGKKSKSMTESVTSLKDEGTRLMGLPVAHSPPPPEIHSAHEHWNSRDHIFKGIMEALKDPHFKLIGVHGAGGVGKTTMVNEAGNKAKGEMLFDVVAMATVSQKMDKKKVQEDLASYLGLELEGNEIARTNLLKHRLNNEKKNLIILDDVWEPLNLEDIGIPVLDGKNGCKVVVTSRRQDVFRKIRQNSVNQVDPRVVKEFRIDILTEEEARTVFMKTAEISDNSEMFPEADVLCRECRGLPVAILAVAGALRGKERYSWKDAVERLKNSELDGIVDIDQTRFSDLTLISTLRLSYDYLNREDTQTGKDAQSCFLLCSLFPEDAKISIDDLVRYSFGMKLLNGNLDTLRNRVLTLVKRLQKDYLLLDGGDENVVSMHDVIRDVAISIAKKDRGYLVEHNLEKWPEKINNESYLAISLRSQNFHGLPNELEGKQFHTIVLKCNQSRHTTVPNNFFKGIENSLEVLDLSEMPMESPPQSIAMLVKLRMLSLNGLTRDIALLGRLKSLEILILHGITELAPEITHLTRLRLLDLSKCHELGVFPPNVISKLQNLEELYISDKFEQWDVEATNQERRNAKVDELNSLTHLTALQVYIPETSLTLLNDSWSSKLKRFRIWIGTNWKTRAYVKYSSRRILGLSNIITLEAKFKVLINKAEDLYLNKLEDLRNVCHDRDGKVFPELKYLRIENCNFVEHTFGTPKMFQPTPRQGSFGNLSSLSVDDCKGKYMFPLSVARCLVKLQKLSITDCAEIEEIVINEGQEDDGALNFPKLEYMELFKLPNLRSFRSSMRETSIKNADNSNLAQPLFSETVEFPSLRTLRLRELKDLREVCHDRDGMVFLELNDLTIWECNNVEHIFGRPKMFQPTPQQQGSFGKLSSLHVWECNKVKYMFPLSVARCIVKLQELSITDCAEIEEIVINEGQEDDGALIFPKLEEMTLSNLPNLGSFRSSMRETSIKNADNSNPAQPLFSETVEFPSLRELELRELKDLREVCHDRDGMVFPELKDLTIRECNNVEHIFGKPKMFQSTPRQQGSFGKLSSLRVENCKVKYLFPLSVARCLVKLQGLSITDCVEIEEIVINEGQEGDGALIFPELEEMGLSKLPNLRSFYSSVKETPIKDADNSNSAQPLFSEIVVFPSLRELRLYKLEDLREMCHDKDGMVFPKLKDLSIQECNNVEHIFGRPKMLQPTPRQGSFGNLSSLSVTRCKVKYLFPLSVARCLVKLQELIIENCAEIEEIVINEGQEDDGALIFPELEEMELSKLPNLKSFYSSVKETLIKDADNSNSAQPLFSETVVFPSLSELQLDEIPNIKAVWNINTPPTNSFNNLTSLEVVLCDGLSYVAPSEVLENLSKLQSLKVYGCHSIEEEVFRSRRSNNEEGIVPTNVVLPHLSSVTLINLLRLKSFCYGIKLPSSVIWTIKNCSSFLRTEVRATTDS